MTQKVTVTVTTERPLLSRIKLLFKRIRFEKPFRKLWMYRMWMHSMFIAQGAAAFFSLSFFNPNLTARPSRYVATQKHDCDEILKEEAKHAEQQEKLKQEAEEKGEVFVPSAMVKAEESDADPMDAWVTKFSKPKRYDARGHLIED